MTAPQIFISYRRDDAAGYARALYDELARRYGAERVFMDVDDIGAGQAFADVIRRAVGASQVLLVLIGRRWIGERDGQLPRLSDAGDFVRLEVAAALARGMRVIPLLLDGATMPSAAQLPAELRPLAGRQALALDNTRFAADLERLAGTLDEALGRAGRAPPRRRWLGLVAAVLAVSGAAVGWRRHATVPPVPPTAPGPLAAARPAIDGVWQAEVVYDWPNARHTERFRFFGDGPALHGSASFLGVDRGLIDGRIGADGLQFTTRSAELGAAGPAELEHRYRGRVDGDALRLVMQTVGGSTAHVPVEIVARRVAPPAGAASR